MIIVNFDVVDMFEYRNVADCCVFVCNCMYVNFVNCDGYEMFA